MNPPNRCRIAVDSGFRLRIVRLSCERGAFWPARRSGAGDVPALIVFNVRSAVHACAAPQSWVAGMFAVVRTGGKQYKVANGDIIRVEKLAGEAGQSIQLDEVLLISDNGATTIGTPVVAGAAVTAEVVAQDRGPKIIVFKKKRRQNYRRKNGHRQDLTVLRITGITA